MRQDADHAVIKAAVTNGADREYEHSPLSGTFTRDGEAVDVQIYRSVGAQDPWQLVVVGLPSGGCTAGQTTCATDQEAYGAFTAQVEADGMVFLTSVDPPA